MTVFCKVDMSIVLLFLYNSDLMFSQSCHEQVKAVNLIVKCKCAILKEESERRQKSRDSFNFPLKSPIFVDSR